jgi:UDP-N-acetylglucosamine 3-dehydrogenase
MIKAAVCGYGNMGKNHVRVYKKIKGVKLECVYDPKIKNGISYQQFISNCKNLDVVSICCPSDKHAATALDLLEANPNIKLLIEKPVDLDIEAAKKLYDYADNIIVGHIERFNPAIIKLKEMIDNDELGQIYSISTKRMGPTPSRELNDVAIDLLVHDIDVVNYLLDQQPNKTYIRKISTKSNDVYDYSSISAKYGDIDCRFEANWVCPKKIRKMDILCEEGLLNIDYINQKITKHNVNGSSQEIEVKYSEPLLNELEHIVSFASGITLPKIKLKDAISVLELVK